MHIIIINNRNKYHFQIKNCFLSPQYIKFEIANRTMRIIRHSLFKDTSIARSKTFLSELKKGIRTRQKCASLFR